VTDDLKWRKSTYSDQNGQCVELAPDNGLVAVRDSKDPQGPTLGFTRGEMLAFIQGAKAGEFDDLVL
jgi:hypothetical protein